MILNRTLSVGSKKYIFRDALLLWICCAGLPMYAGGDGSGTSADSSFGISEKGMTPGSTITSVAGINIEQYKQNLQFSLPLTPEFSTANGIAFGISARYNSNLISYLGNKTDRTSAIFAVSPITGATYNSSCSLKAVTGPGYLPTLFSPFGLGFETGFGVIYKRAFNDPFGDGWSADGWAYQSPDGSAHSLHLAKAGMVITLPVPLCGNPPRNCIDVTQVPPATGRPLEEGVFHLDSFLSGRGSADLGYVRQNNQWEYYTVDGSLIRAKATADANNHPIKFELWLPDGRHLIFDQLYHPVTTTTISGTTRAVTVSGLEELVNEDDSEGFPTSIPPHGGCDLPVETIPPQEMVGFYPSRVERSGTALPTGFNLYYENSSFPYLVTRIKDDTDKTGEITLGITGTTLPASGGGTYQIGNYTSVTYPGANGAPQTVLLRYSQQLLKLRGVGGNELLNTAGTADAAPKTVMVLTEVDLPGGYRQLFNYYNEQTQSGANDDNRLASGRVSRIVTPSGAVHTFTYKQFQFHTFDIVNVVIPDADAWQESYFPDSPSVGISVHDLDLRDAGIDGSGHPLHLSGSDHMAWNYRQLPTPGGARHINKHGPNGTVIYDRILSDSLNIATDPAGNDTAYTFPNADLLGRHQSAGRLAKTEYYQGSYLGSGNLRKRIGNVWNIVGPLPAPDASRNFQLTKTVTELWDDLKGDGTPNTLVEDNLGWDGYGHFTIKRTSGSLVPKARQTVTQYSSDLNRLEFDYIHNDFDPIAQIELGQLLDITVKENLIPAHLRAPGCAYLDSLFNSAQGFNHWFPSLPMSVETQEQTAVETILVDGVSAVVPKFDVAAGALKNRVESRYDAATGLPVRTIARLNPAATASDPCSATLTPQTGDLVTDLYYDPRGNLAMKKAYGGDDSSAFRSYSGTGDAPGVTLPPAVDSFIGIDPTEKIYSPSGSYFGFGRWSRAWTGDAAHGGEAGTHQFLNGLMNTADIEPASGAVKKSFDANGLATLHEYDSLGRIKCSRFLGSDTAVTTCAQLSAIADEPVEYKYLTVPDGSGATRLVGMQSLQDNHTDPTQRVFTQDYTDGLGRKIITMRRNPDGRYAYQVSHYDAIGHVDLVSNWSFITPPGIAVQECTLDQLRAENTPCPSLTPSAWTESALSDYITGTVGAYARNCFRAGCAAWAPYEFAGRVLRAERQDHATLLSAVDTEYFGLNTRSITHGIKTGAATVEDAVTVHYTDGYGNLRIVNADAGATGTGQGADAIYDYDYANHLVKVNLVPQVVLAPVDNRNNAILLGQDRYTTSNADHQLRSFAFDALGRQTRAQNQENGLTKYLRFNALGEILETEDEKGRNGNASWIGTVTTLKPPAPVCTAVCSELAAPAPNTVCWECPAPNILSNGLLTRFGEFIGYWSATGSRVAASSPPAPVSVPAADLYYRVFLDNLTTPVVNWTKGLLNYHATGLAVGTHTLRVEATYAYNLVNPDLSLVAQLPDQFIIATTNPSAYHLLHQYDARGREVAVSRSNLALAASRFPLLLRQFNAQGIQTGVINAGTTTALRQFVYDSDSGDCRTVKVCGKLKHAYANNAAFGTIYQASDFARPDGRATIQVVNAATLAGGTKTFATVFDYDTFGRQNKAFYASDEGPPSASGIMLNFQFGGVRTINRIVGTGQPYATVGRYGDYWPDGSMATFLQGNGLGYHRVIDGAERTRELCYNNMPTNPPFLALCHGRAEPNLWESGVYQYDFAGNIAAIGGDNFTYDRLARLKTATINRHAHDAFGHGPQPAGFVSLNYAYDIFGNIKDRQLTAMSNYTVGQNPLEIFAGRSYTEGVNPVPDNKIHNPNFRYDGNGNLISDGGKDYIYDELNQQIEVRTFTTTCAAAGQGTGSFDSSANAGEGAGATPAGVLCYGSGALIERNGYGADGMRAARDTVFIGAVGFEQAVKRTTYVRLGGNVIKEVTEEINSKNVIQISHSKSYVYGPLGLLATEELCTFNCKSDETEKVNITRYYEYDHLGTIRAITDNSGVLETTFDYEPFGLELKGTTFTWGTDTSSNTHKFTGHERDEEAGEDYMKARMFVLSTARFPQVDPMFGGAQDPQNWNAYIYVGNSPVGASDPTGQTGNDVAVAAASQADTTREAGQSANDGSGWGVFLDAWSGFSADIYQGVTAPLTIGTNTGTAIANGEHGLDLAATATVDIGGNGGQLALMLVGPVSAGVNAADAAAGGAIGRVTIGGAADAAAAKMPPAGASTTEVVGAKTPPPAAAPGETPASPNINPRDVAGKSPAEIDQLALQNGLVPKGPDPMGGKGAYVDPATGSQRVLVHPEGACGHCHVNNPVGERLDINGNVVTPESPEAHLPIK